MCTLLRVYYTEYRRGVIFAQGRSKIITDKYPNIIYNKPPRRIVSILMQLEDLPGTGRVTIIMTDRIMRVQ